MKVGFIGSVAMSDQLLRAVMESDHAEVVGVVTRSSSSFNADFASLAPTATAAGIPVLELAENDQQAIAGFLDEQECDVAYCFGWSYLLGPEILTTPPRGVIGFHPAALPQNRGRHPIIWALALGLASTASTFFLMDEEPDHGPILNQVDLPIHRDDDAASLYARIAKTARTQVPRFTRDLARNEETFVPQDHSRANHWRKRSRDDGRLDMRMSPETIYDLVRALTHPYVGAHCETEHGDVKVWKAAPAVDGRPNDEPGKVLSVAEGTIAVRCAGGSIRLLEHEFDPLPAVGSYL